MKPMDAQVRDGRGAERVRAAQPRKPRRLAEASRTLGLALAGGGPLGAIDEVGALTALSESLEGLDLNDLQVYVGVSSGALIAAGLANGITPRHMARMLVDSDLAEEPFHPHMLLQLALREWARSAATFPSLVLASLRQWLANPSGQNVFAPLYGVSRAIPTGIFDNRAIDAFLRRLFAAPGRTNDFRKLRRKLYLAATDLDSGEAVEFGARGWDHVPISTAVQASAALPGLFPPVEIDGRHYVDGALKKTLHASVALRQGAKLVLCVNPLVPFSAAPAAERGRPREHRVVDGGLPLVLSQTFRAMIHSRMQVGMGKYAAEFGDADVVLFEPSRDDADMFFTNVFSYSSRRRLSEHAYQTTRSELYRRRRELAPILGRHGIGLRIDELRDPLRRLITDAAPPRSAALAAISHLSDSLRQLERWLSQAHADASKAA